ncbi:hypothetical protein D3C72_2123090 [compost metagenome]
MDINVRADGPPCGHLAQHRNFQDLGPTQSPGQANAPGLVAGDLDETGLGQGLDMLARHAARGKAEGCGDVGQARRLAMIGNPLTDESEDGAAFGR